MTSRTQHDGARTARHVLPLMLLAFTACEHKGGATIRLESAAKTYRVELTGHLAKPVFPLDAHYLRATAWRGQEALIKELEVHFADWFDDDFDYGPPVWLQENVVRLGPARIPRFSDRASIRVANQTSRWISWLKVTNQDLILVFDLAPGGTLTIPTSHDWNDMAQTWMHVAGAWQGSGQIPARGVTLEDRDQPRCCTYLVTITDAGVELSQTRRQEITAQVPTPGR